MKRPNPDPQRLRHEAEALLTGTQMPAPSLPADALLHELQVHQIELEMQNQALREAQLALEESRDRYQHLYEFAPVGYLSLSPSGLIEEINLTGANLLGEDRGMLVGQRLAHFVAPADQGRWHSYLRELHALASDQDTLGKPCDLALKRKDGSTRAVSMDCRVNGGISTARRLRITLSDITELKQTLIALRVREDRLQLAQVAAGLGIFDDDLRGGEHMVDACVREIWGFSPTEPLTFEQMVAGIHPDDREAMRAAVAKALDPASDHTYAAQFRVVPQGKVAPRHVTANGQVFFRDGRPGRFVGTVRDVTAQVQLERENQARRNAMDLLARQQVAFQTAAAIAHELNQPLVSVTAYSAAALRLLRDGDPSRPDKITRALEGAAEQSQRAGRTLHELLDFLHKGEAPVEALDLREVVQQALGLAAESGRGLFRPVLDLPPGLPPVLANRLQVQKVIVNLLHNSVDAMRGAGVTDHTIRLTLRRSADGLQLQLTVQDNGPGLSETAARRAFEAFFTTKPNGIGLGLGISRALIEANGGRLWLDPQATPGATFIFTLPLASPPTPTSAP